MTTSPSTPATSSNSPAARPNGTSDTALDRAQAVARDAADPLARLPVAVFDA
jgi:hypothetical protein